MTIELKISFNINLILHHSINLIHFYIEQRKFCWNGVILKQNGKKYLCSIKLNREDRVKISILPSLLYMIWTHVSNIAVVSISFLLKTGVDSF